MKQITTEQLLEVFKKNISNFDTSIIEESSKLTELGVDSVEFVTITFEIEDEFDIEIQGEHLEDVETVADLKVALEKSGLKIADPVS